MEQIWRFSSPVHWEQEGGWRRSAETPLRKTAAGNFQRRSKRASAQARLGMAQADEHRRVGRVNRDIGVGGGAGTSDVGEVIGVIADRQGVGLRLQNPA